MKVAVLHSEVCAGRCKDEDDVLVQAEVVCRALSNLGYEPALMSFAADFGFMANKLRALAPAFVFNLVETVEGRGRLIYLAPAVLDLVGIAYTGATTNGVFQTSNKIVAKQILAGSGIQTPHWLSEAALQRGFPVIDGTYIIKSVWEHASIGLDDNATVLAGSSDELLFELQRRKAKLGGECFAEVFIEGREFNLSLLAAGKGLEVLPPAEIRFHNYPPEKVKVVGYSAKWEPDSFEYQHTPRRFDFAEEDASLLCELESIARSCWDIFALRGYARVDFRVDASRRPWVLEINTNPCLSPDAGFVAATEQAGLNFGQVIARIVADSWPVDDGRRSIKVQPMSNHEQHEGHEVVWPGNSASGLPGLKLPIVFREEVKLEDCENVRSIIESSGFFSPAEVRVAVELVEDRLGKGLTSGYHFLFAEHEGASIGYTCFGPIACTKASYDLYWIAVHNQFRGLGIGRELLSESLRVMERLGGVGIYIETSSRAQYEPTRSFYRSHGFEEAAVVNDFYDNGDHKIIFARMIK